MTASKLIDTSTCGPFGAVLTREAGLVLVQDDRLVGARHAGGGHEQHDYQGQNCRDSGKTEAAKIAKRVQYPGWAPDGPTDIPIQHFSRGDAGVGLNAVLPWFQPTLAVGLADGVGEIDTTALFDVYSYASAARLIPVSAASSITTAHGVVLLTTPAASFRPRASRLVLPGAHSDTEMAPALHMLAARRQLPVTPLGQATASGFDAALTDLASSSGTAISRSTARMVDYPTRPAADHSASPDVRAPILFGLATVLAATVGMIPTLIRVLRRRHLNRHNG